MAARRFAVGERVRSCIPTPFAQAGMAGTVRQVFRSIYDLYDVQFDALIGTCLMLGRELELVGKKPQPAVSGVA